MKSKFRTFLYAILIGCSFIGVKAQVIDESLQLKASVAFNEIEIPEPNRFDPLGLNAKIVWSENKEQCAIILKVELLTDWHIYASVTSASPFIPTEIELELPEKGVISISEWELPESEYYNEDCMVFVGEELHFIKYFKVEKGTVLNGNIKCGLYYQACDPYKCIQPQTKMVSIKINNK